MSERLTAPARSALRRPDQHSHGSHGPVNANSGPEKRPVATPAPSASQKAQTEFAQLSPALQRFWQSQRERDGRLSPRSGRLAKFLPRPKRIFDSIDLPASGGHVVVEERRISMGIGSFLKAHLESLSSEELGPSISDLFQAFDSNHDGYLDFFELKEALLALDKRISEENGTHNFEGIILDNDCQIDMQGFETMVRATLTRSSS